MKFDRNVDKERRDGEGERERAELDPTTWHTKCLRATLAAFCFKGILSGGGDQSSTTSTDEA